MALVRLTLLVSLVLVLGCGDDDATDASVAADATSADVAALDVGPSGEDTGSVDSGSVDSGSVDSGSADSGSIDSGAADSGTADSGAADSGSVDAGPADAGSADTGGACETRIEDRISGVCDGIGMQICTDWANEHGGGNAIARCVSPEGRCARADVCTGAGCTCGGEPECGDGQMCVSGFAGFSCVCIMSDEDAR